MLQLGQVPDFKRLQRQFETQLLRVKASNPFRRTVPQEFLLGGGTDEDRRRRAEERRARLMDERNLTELRWPYASNRARVEPTQPPATWAAPEGVVVGETKTDRLRRQALDEARRSGRYASREEKAALAQQRAQEEKERWASQYVQRQLKAAKEAEGLRQVAEAAGISDGPRPPVATGGRPTTAPAPAKPKPGRAAAESRMDNPAAHIEARHKQEVGGA